MLTESEKEEIKNLSKSIRCFHYEQRKNRIRRRIVPGNNKSLWDAVKIAKDVEPTPLPEKIIPTLFQRDGEIPVFVVK